MEVPDEDALKTAEKTAEKLESEKLAMLNFDVGRMIGLDSYLCDTYDRQCPKEIHYHNRKDLIRIFNVISKEIYGNDNFSPVVEEYGSFVMEIFNERSDLDLSINFRDSIEISRQKKIETLRKFSKKLHKIQRIGHVTALEVILSAKVPIIKVTDSGTGIECDLSVENRDGIAKSHIIRAISSIDERFQKLCLLMKSWAKAHNINSSKDATLNSLSIVSFVAIHLQTRDPPILPPFSTLLKQGADPESVRNIVKDYTNYGKLNKESVAKLFVTFLVKLASVENLWQNGYCASSYEGSWILKSWKRPYSMSVEDFMDRSQNVSRSVGAGGFKAIYKCIHNSNDYISQFLNGEILGIELMDHLFEKPMVSTLEDEGAATSNVNENKKNNPPTLRNPRPQKKNPQSLIKNQNKKSSENQTVRNLQQTEPQGTARMHAPPSNTVPNNQKFSENEIIRDLQRTESRGTAQMHAPSSNTVPNNQKSSENKIVHDLQRTEPQGTARMHPPRNIVPNNQKSSENKETETYDKAKDAAQVYEVKVKTLAAKQGNRSITDYANQLKALWMELDHYRVIKTKCSADAATLKEFIDQDRVYDFLVGLNSEFDQVRIQILGKQKVPSFNEVIAIVRSEESRRSLMLDTPIIENSAMIADLNKGEGTSISADQRKGESSNMERKGDGIWCTFCNKPRHTKEKCRKLHGKPQNRDKEWGHEGSFPRKGGHAHIAAAGTSEGNKSGSIHTVPPPYGLNPVAYQGSYNPSVQSHHTYQGSYNPSIQSHHASLQNSGGYVHAFHQNAVPSNPHHSYVPHPSQPGRDYALYNQRSG